MKKAIEYLAFGSVIFLMATIDSYSTTTLAIIAAVSVLLYIGDSIRRRVKRVNVAHFPKTKDSDKLEKWLKTTIKKIDKMDDI